MLMTMKRKRERRILLPQDEEGLWNRGLGGTSIGANKVPLELSFELARLSRANECEVEYPKSSLSQKAQHSLNRLIIASGKKMVSTPIHFTNPELVPSVSSAPMSESVA